MEKRLSEKDPITGNPLGGTEVEMECIMSYLRTKEDLEKKVARGAKAEDLLSGDEGDEGSARARRPAPCDRARGIRGAIGVETAAHAAVAMARVVAFKPAVGCGGRGRDGQFGLRIPKDSTGGVGSNGLATRAARCSTRA